MFCIKRKTPINQDLYTSSQQYPGLNPYARLIVDEAGRRGIRIDIVDEAFGLFILTLGSKTISCRESLSDLTTAVAMKDQTGPFDYHLSQKLVKLCQCCDIDFKKDVFRYYRSDAASAIEAGHDIRTALVGFGVDASHGYERTHLSALTATARLIVEYIQSAPTFKQDPKRWASLPEFPHQPDREIIRIKT